MKVIDLEKKYLNSYLYCLEEWSEDMKESGSRKLEWYEHVKDKGLIVKLAIDEKDRAIGMIQCVPAELSFIEGPGMYFVLCIWVHGHKQGIGNQQGKGAGKALLESAEKEAWNRGAKGMAARGLILPFWMKSSWFRKHGYVKADRQGIQSLVWKKFHKDAQPPQFLRPIKSPEKMSGCVHVSCFNSGWCQVENINMERIRKASGEFSENVKFELYDTNDPEIMKEWGQNGSIFIDTKNLSKGPPVSYKKIRKKIEKKVKQLK